MSPGLGDMSYGDTTGDYDCSTSATAAAVDGAAGGGNTTTQSQSNKASILSPVLSPTSDTEHDGNTTNKKNSFLLLFTIFSRMVQINSDLLLNLN